MGMKPKTKQFADTLLNDPKISATQAYIKTHKTVNPNTAKVNASKLLTKTNVQIYMDEHVKIAVERIVDIAKNGDDAVAIRAAQDILNRVHGQAIQKTESNVTRTNITVPDNVIADEYLQYRNRAVTE